MLENLASKKTSTDYMALGRFDRALIENRREIQLSHQDKLRLIHFLLLAVAKEEGCELEPTVSQTQEDLLLKQLASTEAVVWSPYESHAAAQTLSGLLVAARQESKA